MGRVQSIGLQTDSQVQTLMQESEPQPAGPTLRLVIPGQNFTINGGYINSDLTVGYFAQPDNSGWPNYAVAYSGDRWVMTGEGKVGYSDDGITWSTIDNPLTTFATCVIWCDSLGLFVMGGAQGSDVTPEHGNRLIYTSPDGITWTGQFSPFEVFWTDEEDGIGFLGQVDNLGWSHSLGQIMAVGQDPQFGYVAMTSNDGITWTLCDTSPHLINHLGGLGGNAVCYSETLGCWIVGSNYSLGFDDGSTIIKSDDGGVTWTGVSTLLGQFNDICWSPTAEKFVICSTASGTGPGQFIMTSPDGITWTLNSLVSRGILGVCWSDYFEKFIGCDRFGSLYASPDGDTWLPFLGIGFQGGRLRAKQII